MNTGLLPLISENGAKTIGAIANPKQYSIIPTASATTLTCHSAAI